MDKQIKLHFHGKSSEEKQKLHFNYKLKSTTRVIEIMSS